MNAADIKNFVFSKSAVGGYKISDVKGCLKEISDYVLSLEEKIFNLDRENKTLKTKLSEVDNMQNEIKEIMVSAHTFKNKIIKETEEKTKEMVASSQEECEKIILEAEDRAQEIKTEAEQKSTARLNELDEQIELKKNHLANLKKEVSDFKVKILEIYKSHLDLITKLPEVSVSSSSNFNFSRDENVKMNEQNKIKNSSDVVKSSKKFSSFDRANFEKIKRNLSNSEDIFQKSRHGVSEETDLERILDGNSYIKSRFDELSS